MLVFKVIFLILFFARQIGTSVLYWFNPKHFLFDRHIEGANKLISVRPFIQTGYTAIKEANTIWRKSFLILWYFAVAVFSVLFAYSLIYVELNPFIALLLLMVELLCWYAGYLGNLKNYLDVKNLRFQDRVIELAAQYASDGVNLVKADICFICDNGNAVGESGFATIECINGKITSITATYEGGKVEHIYRKGSDDTHVCDGNCDNCTCN